MIAYPVVGIPDDRLEDADQIADFHDHPALFHHFPPGTFL